MSEPDVEDVWRVLPNRADKRALGYTAHAGRGHASRLKARRHPQAVLVVDGVIIPNRKVKL